MDVEVRVLSWAPIIRNFETTVCELALNAVPELIFFARSSFFWEQTSVDEMPNRKCLSFAVGKASFVVLFAQLLCSAVFLSFANADNAFLVPREDLLTEEQRPYLLAGKPVPRDSGAWRDDYGRYILKYDSALDCAAEGAASSSMVDLAQVNWRGIGGTNAYGVCAFRIVTSLKSTGDIVAWLQSQGFEVTIKARNGDRLPDLKDQNIRWLVGSWTIDQYRQHRPSLLAIIGLELVSTVNLQISFCDDMQIDAVFFSANAK